MTRLVKIQLTVFAVVTVVALTVMAVVYLQLPRALGWKRTEVALEMPDTGGLYENANVAYLGNTIGRVDSVTLKPGMVMAWMSERGRPRRSMARAATMRAWVESRPPLMPMTILGLPMAPRRWTRAATWML